MAPEQMAIHEEAEGAASRLLAILRKRPLNPAEEQRLMRAFQRMRMACDAAGLVDKKTRGAAKLGELERLLEEICLGGGRKVVIFSEWERMQAMAAEVCERLGVGLNLQAASHVVNLGLPWNPAVLAQRIARVHRLGQREAMALACRALDPRGDPGGEPGALLAAIHGHLVPQGHLAERDASAFARAFGTSAVAPPPSLVAGVGEDAVALLAGAGAGLA